jgi:signal transduction histidine kinase
MRASDWSKTPLGPVQRWPQSLRTAVSICLLSRSPLWIGWGADLVHFYNDACRPVLKDKYPWALGRPALEVWAEMEDVIGPMLRGVLAGGPAARSADQRLFLERNGRVEETYFTFSSSPILDESGHVGGVLTALVETTGQVVGARRLKTLRDLGSRTLDARTMEETVAEAMRVFAENTGDLPFCHVLLRGREGEGSLGLPLDRVAATKRAELLHEVPAGLDGEAASATFLAPLAATDGGVLTGWLAMGVSSRRPFDDGYVGFLELVAAGLDSALARVRTHEVVTELVQSREALRVISQRLEAAQRVGGVGIVDWNLCNDEMYWSPEVYRLMGLAPGAIAPSTKGWTRALAEEDRERLRAAFREATTANRESFEVALRLSQPQGGTRWIRLTILISYDHHEAVRLLGTIVDIEALQQAAHAREAERLRLLTLLKQVPAAVNFLRGPDMVIELAHPMAITGLEGREIEGKPLLEAIPELRDQPHYDRLRRVYETGEPDVRQEVPTWVVVDGRRIEQYWDSVHLPVRDASGQIEGVMTFDLDVTRAVLVRHQLEAADRAKDEFLAMMSHELRTPLNAILGWASILRNNRDEARLARGLEVIERNAKAQERIVSDLLDVSRIISGKLRLRLRRTDVAMVISAAADVVRPAAEAKGIRLALDLDPDVGETVADADRLQQIVWNLLSNAVRFTPRGGGIAVLAERADGGLRIRVEDTGAGIPREHLPHIFERFRQVDSSTTRAHGGLGLGLAIVRHLVEAHGGHVEAHSEGQGRGAAFTVHLPIRAVYTSHAPVEGDTNPGIDTMRSALETGVSLKDVRVLIVDDDADSLELLRAVLSDAGAVVTSAPSAREALDAEGPFDIIVSDIGMPEMDGYTFMQRIRSRAAPTSTSTPPIEGAPTPPAIALTAYARPEDIERAKRAGFQEHLKKPVEPRRLLASMKAWTNTHRGVLP